MGNESLSQKANLMRSEKKWLFNGPKFKTSGVDHYVPEEVQLAIWSYIESRRDHKIPLDYFQAFNLKPSKKDGVKVQLIECHQEVPEHRDELSVICEEPIYEKLFLIDDVDHVTLLLAKEY